MIRNRCAVITGLELEAPPLLVSAKSHVLNCDARCNPTALIMNGHFVRLNCYCKELGCPLSGLCRKCHAGNMGTRGISLKETGVMFSHNASDMRADNDANFIQQEDSFSGEFCHCSDSTVFAS